MAMRRTSAVLLLAASLAAVFGTRAQVSEAELKAAFAYNFALFTQWPADVLAEGAPLRICAAAGARELPALRRLRARTVAGHAIEVAEVEAGGDVTRCHVLLFDVDTPVPAIGAGALTVCDGPRQACGGAVILLAREGDRIRFDVDAARARAQRLSLSSKLLRLARRVL